MTAVGCKGSASDSVLQILDDHIERGCAMDFCDAAESDGFSARFGGGKWMAKGSDMGKTYLGHQS